MTDPSPAEVELEAAWARWRRPTVVVVVALLVAGVVLRFVTTSPLWLDEALSVNIARLPLGGITEALRHDGHPRLYYVLLHAWMSVFGEGDAAVRALSGVFGLALLPLLWVAGRRLAGARGGWYALGVAAVLPYALRYSTETRMYALVMVLVLAGWLLLDDLLRRPSGWRAAGLAAVTAALLWTHYWALWLGVVTGGALVVRLILARRRGDAEAGRRSLVAIGALAMGGLAFLPWLPILAYQGQHTGTPWARPVRPTEMLTFTVADLGGGAWAESIILGWLVMLAAFIGLTGRARGGWSVELDLRTRRVARPLGLAIVGTLAIAAVVGYATGATYAGRYAAVFVPFLVLLAALGLARLDPRAALIGLLVLGGLGLIGAYRNVTVARTDAQRSADAIEARGAEGDVVLTCPDQLGPSTARVLDDRFDVVTYPGLAEPELVDWVDYTDRLDAADPADVAGRVLERAGDRQVFLVYSTSYDTHEDICPALFNALGAARSPEVLTQTSEAFEPSGVAVFLATTG